MMKGIYVTKLGDTYVPERRICKTSYLSVNIDISLRIYACVFGVCVIALHLFFSLFVCLEWSLFALLFFSKSVWGWNIFVYYCMSIGWRVFLGLRGAYFKPWCVLNHSVSV